MRKGDDAADEAKGRLAKLRDAIGLRGAGRDAATRKTAEKTQRRANDKRAIRATGRTALFNFRAHAKLQDACKAAANARNMKLAEWMEQHLAAALEAEGRDTSFLGVSILD